MCIVFDFDVGECTSNELIDLGVKAFTMACIALHGLWWMPVFSTVEIYLSVGSGKASQTVNFFTACEVVCGPMLRKISSHSPELPSLEVFTEPFTECLPIHGP